MTSPTAKTETRRKMRKVAMGNKRKNALSRTGTTTTLFTLNKPTDAEKSVKGGKATVAKKAAAPKAAAPKAAKKEAAPKAAAAPKKEAAPKTTKAATTKTAAKSK